MSRNFAVLGWVLLVVFAAGIGVTGWQIYFTSGQQMCAVCHRHIHAETRTVAEANGERIVLCCPTCVRMVRKMRGVEMQVVQLTDHETREPLDSADAWLVVGSALNYCTREQTHVDEHKQAAMMGFDRCAPSIIAFAGRDAAEDFRNRHGGELHRFGEFTP